MSKIDDYIEQKNKSTQALMDLADAGFTFGIWKRDSSRDELCNIFMQMSRMWGDTVHVVNDTDVTEYLLKAVTENKKFIIEQAILLAKSDIETARLAAEDEAREVLQIINSVIEE